MKLIEKHYRENYNKLVNYVSKRTNRAQAEEIVQDVYLSALEYAQKNDIEDINTLILYLIRPRRANAMRSEGRLFRVREELIARETEYGVQHRIHHVEEDYSEGVQKQLNTILLRPSNYSANTNPEYITISNEIGQGVVERIETKPEHMKRVLELALTRNMRPGDIAKVTRTSPENTAVIIHRFRRGIKKFVRDWGYKASSGGTQRYRWGLTLKELIALDNAKQLPPLTSEEKFRREQFARKAAMNFRIGLVRM